LAMLRATLSTTIRAVRTRSTGTAHRCIAIPLDQTKRCLTDSRQSMMPKSGYRFSENIMLQQKAKAG
jgi:hypothetical protein